MPLPVFKLYDVDSLEQLDPRGLGAGLGSPEQVAAGEKLPRDLHLALVEAISYAEVRATTANTV